MRESGAVASQFHIPEAIEPYSSELVKARRGIVLGKKSGLDSIDLKCKELGLHRARRAHDDPGRGEGACHCQARITHR